MNRTTLIMLFVSIFAFSGLQAQWGNPDGKTTLNSGKQGVVKWDKMSYDFGKMKKGNPDKAEFKMTNTGGKPILITNAKGSCGCTEIEYPKRPIRPGETVKILINYDAEELGEFNKTVTLTMNIEKSSQVLHISGSVE